MTSSLSNHAINSSIDEKNKTLTIRQFEYSLQKGSYLPGYHTIIYATTVRINDDFKNPGCDLHIHAAEVIVAKKGGLIDVTGADGLSYNAGDRSDGYGTKSGTFNGADGANGDNGGAGQDAGTVSITAGKISGGELTLLGNGGNGGRAQDGGNGANAVVPTAKGTVKRPKKVFVGTKLVYLDGGVSQYQDIYEWGKDVKELASNMWGARLRVAHQAKKGATGGNGGHAGLAGTAGNGGNAATVTIKTLEKTSSKLSSQIRKGLKGAEAKTGTPGNYANGGLGGKYLYQGVIGSVKIDWSTVSENDKWTKIWSKEGHLNNLGVNDSQFIKEVKGKKALILRNKSGGKGKKGGYGSNGEATIPLVKKAVDGQEGQTITEVITVLDSSIKIPHAYFLLLQRSASIAISNANREKAITILQWLLYLTSAFTNLKKNATEQDREAQQINLESEATLLTLYRHDNKNLSKRFIYKDIERYANFVETSLDHVRFQSQYFREFVEAVADRNKQKIALKNAIKETQQHVEQLTGNNLTPGSINYLSETEKQLKRGLTDLDLQLITYKDLLENMPTDLENELQAKYHKETQVSFWDILQYFSMAAGVVMNFGSAVSSIKSMVSKVEDFYKEAMELTSWSAILKEGIWNREFTELKNDLSQLINSSEFKKMSKDGKAFITSVTDFQGKVKAYEKLVANTPNSVMKMDLMDIQASVLVFDMAKLKMKKQRTELEKSLRNVIDDSKAAQKWQHLFTDYFDSTITRFNMLAHLADLQASRRQLEFQRAQLLRNVTKQQAELEQLMLNTEDTNFISTAETLESNLTIALQQSLERIRDEYQAYAIWTLQEVPFPKIIGELTLDSLKMHFHQPIWDLIKDKLSSASPPARRDFSDAPRQRKFEIAKEGLEKIYFNKAKGRWHFLINIPLDLNSNIYFQRLIDAKVFLKGVTIAEDSAFHCILRHRGVSRYLNVNKLQVRADQNKRSVEFSYIIENGKPNYHYPGAITTPFDDEKDWLSRIRYSPFTTWEVEVIPNYKQNKTSKIYNKDIDFSNFEAIEFRYQAFFESFAVVHSAA